MDSNLDSELELELETQCNHLIQILVNLIVLHWKLLSIVRKERQLLVATNLSLINENNTSKDQHLIKIRSFETSRNQQLLKITKILKIDNSNNDSLKSNLILNSNFNVSSSANANANGNGNANDVDTRTVNILDLSDHITNKTIKMRLIRIRSILKKIVHKIFEENKKNEILVKAALNQVDGAMKSIKESLSEKPIYKKEARNQNFSSAGQLVRREV